MLKEKVKTANLNTKKIIDIKSSILCFTIFIFFVNFFPNTAFSQGDLLLTPRRIVFDGTQRSIDLNLANIGKDTAIYAISMIQLRMNENGGFERITVPDEDQKFANKNLRYFPRIVTLPPKEAQVVKVQIIRKNQMEQGEYRSHFYFRSIPPIVPLTEEVVETDAEAISVRLTPIYGITIPAIIRIGRSNTKVDLSVTSIDYPDERVPILSLKFERRGNFSVYGNLIVDHISTMGVVTRVGMANGIAVYTPNKIRTFQFQLNDLVGVDYKQGKLQIQYLNPSDLIKGNLAETEILLHE